MHLLRYNVLLLCCIVPLAGLDFSESADACGTASRADAKVRIAEESAIIVWDAAAKVQHFIRRASFDADTPDFAFLVPTPTQPTLSQAKDEAFALLEKLIVPKIVEEYQFMPNIACGNKSKEKPAGVRVLEEGRVAGFDYKIFETDTSQDLYDWLKKNDYVTRLDLKEWVEPYVRDKWKFTVFKIAKAANKDEIATSAVRMSFSAEKPFFPYSEPAQQRLGKDGQRLLRVFFVGEKRYEGTLGAGAAWPGRTVWAGRLQPEPLETLASSLAMPVNLPPPWLTVFEDYSSPRPGTSDVFFFPSSAQDEVYRTVRVRVDLSGWTCLGMAVILVVVPIMLVRWRRRGAR